MIAERWGLSSNLGSANRQKVFTRSQYITAPANENMVTNSWNLPAGQFAKKSNLCL
jgi:hypothetical protein